MGDANLHKIDQKGNLIKLYAGVINLSSQEPVGSPRGIEFDGKYFWITVEDVSSTYFIYQIDMKGIIIKSMTGVTKNYGVTTDGKNLIISTADSGTINVLDKKGNQISTLASNFYYGLALDGKNLLGIVTATNNFEVFSVKNYKIIKTVTVSSNSPGGITVHGKDIAIVSATDFTLNIYNRNGTLIKSIALDINYNYVDVCFDGEFYWLLSHITGGDV